GVPRAARVERGLLRGADDRDGLGLAQRGRDDRSADALHEQGATGGYHAGDHRGGERRRSALALVTATLCGLTGNKIMATATETTVNVGKVVQVIGPVVDVEFEGGHLPQIYH